MHLYEIDIERAEGHVLAYLVAPDEPRGAELVWEHHEALGLDYIGFSIQRIDETLPEDRRKGLDDLLESAPVCFASYLPRVGWIPHSAPAHKLKLFRIEERTGKETFVIAPNPDMAKTIFTVCVPLPLGKDRMFRVHDGLTSMAGAKIMNIHDLLLGGQTGIVAFDRKKGWHFQ